VKKYSFLPICSQNPTFLIITHAYLIQIPKLLSNKLSIKEPLLIELHGFINEEIICYFLQISTNFKFPIAFSIHVLIINRIFHEYLANSHVFRDYLTQTFTFDDYYKRQKN